MRRTSATRKLLTLRGATPMLGYLAVTVAMVAAIAVVLLLSRVLIVPNAGIAYLLIVMAAALWLGTGPATLAGLIAVLAVAYFYIPLDANVATSAIRLVFIVLAIALSIAVGRFARRERERALALSRQAQQQAHHWSLLLDSLDEGVFGVDKQGRCTFINKTATLMLGYEPDEVLEKNIHRLIHYQHKDGSPYPEEQCPMFRALRSGEGSRVEGEVLWRRDGTYFPAEYASHPLQEGGEIKGGVVTFVDITERKQAEQALAMARERLAADLDAMTRLQAVGTLFVREGDIKPVLDAILEAAIAIADADMGNIQLLDAQSGSFRIVAHRGFAQPFLDFWDRVCEGQGACGTAAARGERVIVEDISQSPIFAGTAALRVQWEAGVRAVQSTPLISRSGKPLGILSTHYKAPRRPDERALRLLDALARQAADIVERAQAERERERLLAEAEAERARLAAVVQQMPSGVIIVEVPSGKLIMGNAQVERIWRQPLLASTSIAESVRYRGFHPDGRPYRAEEWPLARAVATGEAVQDEEIDFLRGDGSCGTMSVSASPVRDREGRVVAAVVVFHDVSERKKALREYQTVLKAAMDGFWIADTEGRLLDVNDNYCRLSGYAREELLSMRVSDVEAAETPEETARHIERIREQDFDRFETRHRRKDGGIIDFEISVTYLAGDKGRMFAFLRDITERKQVERALREARDYAERLIQISSVMVIGLDAAGNIRVFNEAAEKLTGYKKAELEGRNWFEVLVPKERYPEVWELFTTAMAGGSLPVAFENPILTRSGEERYIAWRNSVMQDGGKITGTISFGMDITEQRELDRLKEQFIAIAAHELKTPVTIMKGCAQALLRAAERTPEQRRKMLEAIDRGSARIDAVVQDLLDISKLAAGGLELTVEAIDLSALVSRCVDQMALVSDKHAIRLVRAEPVIVRGDPARLEQVVINVLENAVKYSPQGGEIEVAVAVDGKEAVVSVRDYGVGIPKERQRHLFQRFYSAHTGTPYDYGGMAVGLYISKEIVSRHGGRMWLESEEGRGSTFSFSLPLAEWERRSPATTEAEDQEQRA